MSSQDGIFRRGVACAAALAAALGGSATAQAVPKFESTTLPLEVNNDALKKLFENPENLPWLTFITGFTVYQDSEDTRTYYYVPVFRAVPREGGAATAIVNKKQIDRADEIDDISRKMTSLRTIEYTTVQSQYLAMINRLATLKPAEEPIRPRLEALRDQLKAELDRLTQQANSAADLLPQAIRNAFVSRMGDLLAAAGFSLHGPALNSEDARRDAFSKLSRSNGGMVTANVYAGVTSADLAKVVAYKAARASLGLPQVRIVKIPVEHFTWGSLAETVASGESNKSLGVPISRSISGAGTFEGATINMDLTVDGARAFVIDPPPLILPVYVKGTTIKKYPAFEATLSCNFTTGWYMKGRADVKDGLIIYNNDVTMGFDVGSVATSNAPCSVTFHGGGAPNNEVREAAIRKSFLEIQARLGETFLYRSNLAMEDRRAYFQHVVADVQANRYHGRKQSWLSFIPFVGGFLDGFIGSLSHATSFYWHTDIQDIKNTDSLKWEQTIRDDGNTSVTIDLAASICLAYNPDRKVYLACSEKELDGAQSTTGARQSAAASPQCTEGMTSAECGEQRSMSAPRNPDTGNTAPDML